MSFARSESISITTAAGGGVTAYSANIYTGRVLKIIYGGEFDATLDTSITTEFTGQQLWTETDVAKSATFRCPRDPTHSSVGVASLYDTVSSEPVEDYIWAVKERIKFVLAQGGNAVTGTFRVIVG